MESTVGDVQQQGTLHFDATLLAPHETMELHELLNLKTTSAAKAKAMDGLLTDRDLKALVQEDLQHSLYAIERLEEFLRPRARSSAGR